MFPDPWALAAIAAKTLMYLGIFTSTGLVLAQIVFATPLRPLASWIARRAAIFATLGLIGTIAAYSLRGAQLTGNAMGLIDPVMLGLLWDTAVGEVLRLRCI
ncbi:MAG: copper-binding protein, partial [Pseudomonadota bacterium]